MKEKRQKTIQNSQIDTNRDRAYWRSFEEYFSKTSASKIDQEAGEFPPMASLPPSGVNRRDFFKLLGASMALAGLDACTQPPREKVLPYVQGPQHADIGVPLYYASAMVLDGYAKGILVKSNEGRPTKIEGNPEHPASLGVAGLFEQALVLSLYDPHRARSISRKNNPSSSKKLLEAIRSLQPDANIRFLLLPQSSPLLESVLQKIQERFLNARVSFYSPLARQNSLSGAQLAFGRPLETRYNFRNAKVVLSLDADFLSSMPNSYRWAREFADQRRQQNPSEESNRLYQVEPTPSATGVLADHRLRLRAQDILPFASSVLLALQNENILSNSLPPEITGTLSLWQSNDDNTKWIQAVVKDLKDNAGQSIVIAGDSQPKEVHLLTNLINTVLGNISSEPLVSPVSFQETPLLADGLEGYPISELCKDCEQNSVDALFILGGNPSYTMPADLRFSEIVSGMSEKSFYLGLYENETARDCEWFIPQAHTLESWGDARSYDGTVTCIQPLIRPMYNGKTNEEFLSLFAFEQEKSAFQLLQEHWSEQFAKENNTEAFEASWNDFLQRGLFVNSSFSRVLVALDQASVTTTLSSLPARTTPDSLELHFLPDPKVYDGRFSNNAWLQELPSPMTKLTWDNAALISPKTAQKFGVENEDMITLSLGERKLVAPALILPGQADSVVSLALGYGRKGSEALAKEVGVNAYVLRTIQAPYFAQTLTVEKTGSKYPLALTQTHWTMEGRPIAPMATLEEYRNNDSKFSEILQDLKIEAIDKKDLLPDTDIGIPDVVGPPPGALQPDQYNFQEQWAMTIDTSVCTGCSACVVACQAENNIPIVGKEGVAKSREMHWLRIDRYFVSTPDKEEEPEIVNQPMLCQHCEKAPCEHVCPVNATVHSTDGLNEMIYNRCVGTRFCSNNCPYKVRRFNFFSYVNRSEIRLQRNPEVTVRERGVMEKCSYCVQRIRAADIRSQIEGRNIEPDEVTTACQQACPTQAIAFGSLRHQETKVFQWRAQKRSYAVLNILGTRPRTQYLAKITNPNPVLSPKQEILNEEEH